MGMADLHLSLAARGESHIDVSSVVLCPLLCKRNICQPRSTHAKLEQDPGFLVLAP